MLLRTSLRQLNWAYINHTANTRYYFSWSQSFKSSGTEKKKKRKLGGKVWSIWQLAIYIKFPYGQIILYLHRLHSTVMTLIFVSHAGITQRQHFLFCNSIWITRENFILERSSQSFSFFSCLLNENVARKMGQRNYKMDVICTRVFLTRKQVHCMFNKRELLQGYIL